MAELKPPGSTGVDGAGDFLALMLGNDSVDNGDDAKPAATLKGLLSNHNVSVGATSDGVAFGGTPPSPAPRSSLAKVDITDLPAKLGRTVAASAGVVPIGAEQVSLETINKGRATPMTPDAGRLSPKRTQGVQDQSAPPATNTAEMAPEFLHLSLIKPSSRPVGLPTNGGPAVAPMTVDPSSVIASSAFVFSPALNMSLSSAPLSDHAIGLFKHYDDSPTVTNAMAGTLTIAFSAAARYRCADSRRRAGAQWSASTSVSDMSVSMPAATMPARKTMATSAPGSRVTSPNASALGAVANRRLATTQFTQGMTTAAPDANGSTTQARLTSPPATRAPLPNRPAVATARITRGTTFAPDANGPTTQVPLASATAPRAPIPNLPAVATTSITRGRATTVPDADGPTTLVLLDSATAPRAPLPNPPAVATARITRRGTTSAPDANGPTTQVPLASATAPRAPLPNPAVATARITRRGTTSAPDANGPTTQVPLASAIAARAPIPNPPALATAPITPGRTTTAPDANGSTTQVPLTSSTAARAPLPNPPATVAATPIRKENDDRT